MRNDTIKVMDLAKELKVAPGDIQHALHVMKLPERQSVMGQISGQHANMIRNGLKGGAWRPRSRGRQQIRAVQPTRPPATRKVGVTCDCCLLPFLVAVTEDVGIPSTCGACLQHQGADAETLRLSDHLEWTRDRMDAIRDKANEMARAKDEAFETRNKWRRALVELMLNHGPDEADESTHCACGEPAPCTTRRLLVSVNPGIASQVERFEEMHDAQRASELTGRKWTWEDEQNYQESREAERGRAG
jgi:hypothetical protein